MCDVVHHVLQDLGLVGASDQGIEARADFALASGCHFVVMHLNRHSHLLKDQTHGRADVLQRINRRNREITALDARTMADIAIVEHLGRVPRALVGIDMEMGALHFNAPTDVVEDEKLGFRTEIRGVTNAGSLEIGLGTFGD